MHLEEASYSARATWQYWSAAVFAALPWATVPGRTIYGSVLSIDKCSASTLGLAWLWLEKIRVEYEGAIYHVMNRGDWVLGMAHFGKS